MAVQVTVLSIDDEQLSAPKKSLFSKNEISIGRSRLNDLVLEHPGVSNTHARVRIEGSNGTSKFYVSDLDSTNGTMVGNKRLDPRSETLLAERDRIMIAGYILKVDTIAQEVPETVEANSNVIASGEPKLPEGKTTNSYVIVEEVKLVEAPTFVEPAKKAKEPSGTIWNSSLLGAFRDEKPAEVAKQLEVVKEEAKEQTSKPKEKSSVEHTQQPAAKQTKDSKELSWSITDEPEEAPLDHSSVPTFSAETKLLVEDNLTIDFVATKLLSIVGKVLHKSKPLPGVKIEEKTLGTAWSDAQGEFAFEDVIEGTAYSLSFEKEGYLLSPMESSGTLHDDNLSIEVAARKLFSITGSITHRGSGLDGVRVDGGKLGVTTTDHHGFYKFDNVAEGEEYTLKATKEGYSFGTVRKSA